MKKLIALAGIVVSAFLGSLAFTGTANAATCSTTTGGFPINQYWYCGTTPGYKSGMEGALTRIGADGISKLSATPADHQFYSFINQSDYDSTCSVSTIPCGQTLGASEQGRTWVQSGKTYTLVLEDHQGSTNPVIIGNYLTNAMAHEAGHHLDPLYGPISGAALASSNSTTFDTKLGIDITKFNALATKCGGAGIFSSQYDQAGLLICSSKQTATIGGTASNGQIQFLVNDPAISGGSAGVLQSYTSGQTTTQIATNLAASLNAVTALTSKGITATSSGAVVTVTAATGNQTTFSVSYPSGSRTVSSPAWVYGTGASLNTQKYSASLANWDVLQLAWPHFFTQTASPGAWKELFAEEVAQQFSSTQNGDQTPDLYIKNNFTCSKLTVNKLVNTGAFPSAANYTSAHCP